MAITTGSRVEVVTALGERVQMRALSGPERGRDFEVVWVATEEDYDKSGDQAEGIPWPVEAVAVLEPS
jgi:hypothetical protein